MPSLDGLRGLAVIAVIGYHGGVFFKSGGFYGVDMFFTLSGFLITSLLVAEWEHTSVIRLRAFWARRARRLLPALLVMLLGVVLYNALLVPPGTYAHLRSDGIAALFYFANWHYIAIGSNYFAQTGPTSPLVHTWSLAVEEQFYLIWPLIVLGVLRLSRSKLALLLVCIVGALASEIEMVVRYSPAHVNRVYYGTDTRAQSLLIGAALAVGLSLWSQRRQVADVMQSSCDPGRPGVGGRSSPKATVGRVVMHGVGPAGLAGTVVLWTALSAHASLAYRGGFLLAALATSAVLLSVVHSPRSILTVALSWPPLRFVGRISYGLYLWHFPLFLYLDGARVGLTGYPLFGVRVAVTIVVASASFYLLEDRIRRGTFLRGWRGSLAPPVAVASLVVALCTATAAPALADGSAIAPRSTGRTVVFTKPPVKVLWVGDSAAFTLAIALSAQQRSYGFESFDGAILGCGVTNGAEFQLANVDAPMATQCRGGPSVQWPRLWLSDIATYRPDVVVLLAGRWEVVNRTYDGRWTNIEDPAYASYVKRQLEYATAVAGSGGAHVILMTAPCYATGEQPDGGPWPEDSQTRLSIFNQLVRQVAATTPNASLLDFNPMVCPGGRYEQFINGVQVRQPDGVHFALGAGSVLAQKFWPVVAAAGSRLPPFSATYGSRTQTSSASESLRTTSGK